MATTTIPWGDGSGDNIYLTYSSASGNQTVEVTSDANTGYVDRTKDITFTVVAGQSVITRTLTVIQLAGSDLIVPVFNGVYPAYDDVARGFVGRILPAAYQAVDYITLSTQIDTGEKTTRDSLIEAEIYISSTNATYIWRSDSGSNLSTNTTAYYYTNNGNWRFGDKTLLISQSSIRGAKHKISQSSDGVFIDGVQMGSYTGVSDFTSSSNLLVGSASAVNVRYYYFRHIKDGITVSDYEPCIRIADSVAGFYDHIKGVFVAGGSAPSA